MIIVGWEKCHQLMAGINTIYVEETNDKWIITFWEGHAQIYCEVTKPEEPEERMRFVDMYLQGKNIHKVLKIETNKKYRVVIEEDVE